MVESTQLNGGEHSLLSPSGAPRWMNCAGAVHLEDTLEDEVAFPAEEGTVAHFVASECLTKKQAPEDYLGKVITSPEGVDVTVDQEMVEGVSMYIAEVHSAEAELGVTASVETKFVIVEGVISGTADALTLNLEENAAKVQDFKYGAGVEVFPEWNEQGMLYAIGALRGTGAPPDLEIEISIVQPRIFSDRKVKSWFTTYGELLAWYEFELIPAMENARHYNENFNPGEAQCRFCKAAKQGACEALKEAAFGEAMAVSYPFPKRMDDLNTEEISAIVRGEAAFKNWTKRIQERIDLAKSRGVGLLEAGCTVEGVKLVKGRKGASKWLDEAAAVKLLTDADVYPFADQSVVSPAVARKRLKEAEVSLVEMEKICEAKAPVQIVPEEDKRKELPASIDTLFAGDIIASQGAKEK